MSMSRKRYNFTLSSDEMTKLDSRRGMVPRSVFIGYLIEKGRTRADLRAMANDWCEHVCHGGYSGYCGECVFAGRLKEFLDYYEESNQ